MGSTKNPAEEISERLARLERSCRQQAVRVDSLRKVQRAEWPSIERFFNIGDRGSEPGSDEQAQRIRKLETQLTDAQSAMATIAHADTAELDALRAEIHELRNAAAVSHDDSELKMEVGFLKRQLEQSKAALAGAQRAADDTSNHDRLVAGLEQARAGALREVDELRWENGELREQLASMLSHPVGPGEDSALHSEISLLRDQLEIEKSKQGAPANDSALRAEIVTLQEQLEAAKLVMETSGGGQRDHISEIGSLTHQLQQQLLELEQLRNTQSDLNRLVEEWRSRARRFEKTNKEISVRKDHAAQQLEAERQAVEQLRGRIKSLEATVHEQKKDLSRAEAREEHLRKHIKRSG